MHTHVLALEFQIKDRRVTRNAERLIKLYTNLVSNAQLSRYQSLTVRKKVQELLRYQYVGRGLENKNKVVRKGGKEISGEVCVQSAEEANQEVEDLLKSIYFISLLLCVYQ